MSCCCRRRPYWVQRHYIRLGGTNEYVDTGVSSGSLNFERTDPFSFALWLRYVATGSFMGVIEKMEPLSTFNTGYDLHVKPSGQIGLNLNHDVRNPHPNSNLLALRMDGVNPSGVGWFHLVMAYDGSSTGAGTDFYFNGVLQTTTELVNTLTSSIQTTETLCLGRRVNASPDIPYTGDMDEVAVFDKKLSAPEVAELYNGKRVLDYTATSVGSDLLLYYRVAKGDVYPTIADYASGGNDGTMTNMETTDLRSGA